MRKKLLGALAALGMMVTGVAASVAPTDVQAQSHRWDRGHHGRDDRARGYRDHRRDHAYRGYRHDRRAYRGYRHDRGPRHDRYGHRR